MGPKACVAVLVLALTATLAVSSGAARAEAIDSTLAPSGDATHGETLFKQRCSICHQADKGGKNGIGPALYGAYGRKVGQAPGFTYSGNVATSAIVWTPEKLNQWIQKPTSLIPGAKMTLPPVTAAQDRADIIAFLKSKSTSTAQAAAAPAPAKKKAKKAS